MKAKVNTCPGLRGATGMIAAGIEFAPCGPKSLAGPGYPVTAMI